MKIIDFLMDNIFIVVIIFGALASLFGKSGSKKKLPGQMPDFGGGGLPRNVFPQTNDPKPVIDQQAEMQGNEGQTVYRSLHDQERQTVVDAPYERSYIAAPPETARSAARERALQGAKVSGSASRNVSERNSAAQEMRDSSTRVEDMRKAVVWAEVLGPPRSKKPFGK
ncbi:hypothetical protein BK133_12745 [Paenibacillus sp. FSL H8-0548]|uniref:hypothetical protein n=1 Tax=Paenibacillus sp. FSL H8-0548 TaxID=1920422 RepID=UPI00096DBAD1|nr:hypothetical protein [Paenibacillus sp. FSL H8-0548]OMF34188.1 hypothetical protein BK133_12745 [Paenibacillus sp. FSL H8-0548]